MNMPFCHFRKGRYHFPCKKSDSRLRAEFNSFSQAGVSRR